MKKSLLLLFVLIAFTAVSQTSPKLYIGIGSHNEMKNTGTDAEPYDNPDGIYFNKTKDSLKKIVDMILLKGAKYNLQTCQRFVYASHQHEAAGSPTVTTDILEYCYKLGGIPYGSVVEIDPRSKTATANMASPVNHTLNMADVAHMIDSTGAAASKNVGGFIYKPSTSTNWTASDWTQYTTTITGIYNTPWKANILWGAGAAILPVHTQDANNFGVWKPRGTQDSLDFYCHDPAQNVWVQGNGCGLSLDTVTDIQTIISEVRDLATKIANGTYPSNKFYCATIMFHFKHFQSLNYRKKLTQIIDSVNVLAGQNKVVWATISQKHTAFQAWSTASGVPYSQWRCGQTTTLAPTCAPTAIAENETYLNTGVKIYPNPATNTLNYELQTLQQETSLVVYDNFGRIIMRSDLAEQKGSVTLDKLAAGVYYITINTKSGVSKPEKLIISE